MNVVTLTDGRLAVADRGRLLSVPPMHPLTSQHAMAQVLDYVLRRQYGLACTIADSERELIEYRERHVPGVAKLMAETPHATDQRRAA